MECYRELVHVACTFFVQMLYLCHLLQVPLLAAGLMLISEVFGSRVPDASGTVAAGEKLTHWEVFSNAFTLLLRFWRFDRLPVEQVRSGATAPPFGSLLSPECLLLVRNSKLASLGRTAKDQKMLKRWSNILSFPADPIFIDFFPKLNYWYRKHQDSIASTRSGLVPGGPVHRIVDALLSMMFSKVSNGAEPSTPTTSGNNSSSGLAFDDALKVPAWDILEAIPFVLDASLTSCAYGKLSTRDLATGMPCSLFVSIIFNFNLARIILSQDKITTRTEAT